MVNPSCKFLHAFNNQHVQIRCIRPAVTMRACTRLGRCRTSSKESYYLAARRVFTDRLRAFDINIASVVLYVLTMLFVVAFVYASQPRHANSVCQTHAHGSSCQGTHDGTEQDWRML